MHIEPVAYMEWAKLHKRKSINLSPSGMPKEWWPSWPGHGDPQAWRGESLRSS